MPEKLGNGGHGKENYDPETGRYVSEETFEAEYKIDYKVNGKGDLETISQNIIESKKEHFIKKLSNLLSLENLKDIILNPKKTKKERYDDNHGIDYYLETDDEGTPLGLDDKTGVNTKNFTFEIYKNVNGKDVTAWFTNKYKLNDFVSFGNLLADEESNVYGYECDVFDQGSLANCVLEHIELTDFNIDPDSYLYNMGKKLCKNAKFNNKDEEILGYKKKDGSPVKGAYIRIRRKPNDKRGPTLSVSIEIDKDIIRNMCESDEHQFIKLGKLVKPE